MDDPAWSWPAWKFGMKREELFTTLHDQYNTFSFSIQDPEAFHHDVWEISRDASTTDEFHRLMATRQQQRLRELNDALESLSFEIIGNPKLIASDQWRHALQLFRSKSYDSIVRYFASYIPDGYFSTHDSYSTTSSSFSETDSVHTSSTKTSSVDSAAHATFLNPTCCSDGPVMTEEPCSLDSIPESVPVVDGPLSPPESEVTQSDLSESLPAGSDTLDFDSHPRSRSMSFSGSESERFYSSMMHPSVRDEDEDETSQSDDTDTAISSLSDCADSPSSLDSVNEKENCMQPGEAADDDFDFPTTQLPEDTFDVFDSYDTPESDTPTPRQEPFASSYIEYKSVAARRLPSPYRRSRSPSPRIIHPHGGGGGPVQEIRRSPEEALSKIQKSLSDPMRKRGKDRRRLA